MGRFSSKLPNGVRRLFRLPRTRARMLREVDDEIRAHIEMRATDLIARGMTEGDARAEALRRFGDAEAYWADEQRRAARQSRRLGAREWLEEARRDLAYTWRGLRRSPGLTASVVGAG